MSRRTAALLIVLALSATLVACSSASDSTSSSADDLEGVWWALEVHTDAQGAESVVIEGVVVDAFFEDGRVGGNAGCNQYSGSYAVDGDEIQVGELATTMIACPIDVMDQESAYLASMQSAASFEISDGKLSLFDEDGGLLLRFAEAAQPSLVGTAWKMISYNNGKGGVVSALADADVTAEFSEDGSLSGSAGCNEYSASYEAEYDKMTISGASSTEMYCESPEGVMEQEDAYLDALQAVATYEIRGEHVTMRDAGGAIQVEFAAE